MISIVSSLYKSKSTVIPFIEAVGKSLAEMNEPDYEIVLVSDGDPTLDEALEDEVISTDSRVRLCKLSRNFGHHTALFCGIECARGEEIVVLDSDMEENPAYIAEFLQQLRTGNSEIVIGLQSRRNKDSLAGSLFWKLRAMENRLPPNVCTLRAFTRKYADQLLKCGDSDFLLGDLDDYVGFKKIFLPIEKTYKGHSTYSLVKKIQFFASSIVLGSPGLLITTAAALAILALLSVLFVFGMILFRMVNEYSPGWSSIMVSIFIGISINLFGFGVMFLYISRIFSQTKSRPRYVVEEIKQKEEGKVV